LLKVCSDGTEAILFTSRLRKFALKKFGLKALRNLCCLNPNLFGEFRDFSLKSKFLAKFSSAETFLPTFCVVDKKQVVPFATGRKYGMWVDMNITRQ
jgi:hypothetical protein